MAKPPVPDEERQKAAEDRLQLLLRGKAYQMFYEELHRSVKSADHDFGKSTEGSGDSHFPEEQAMPAFEVHEMRRRFHSLKGSSGFFGFSDIKTTAGKLEEILTTLEPSGINALNEARKLIAELQRLTGELPLPSNKE